MFEVGFSELIMIGLVSLLVVGPERLPSLVKTVGFWIGRIQGIMSSIKAEFEHELEIENMRQMVNEQSSEMKNMLEETKDTIQVAKNTLNDGKNLTKSISKSAP